MICPVCSGKGRIDGIGVGIPGDFPVTYFKVCNSCFGFGLVYCCGDDNDRHSGKEENEEKEAHHADKEPTGPTEGPTEEKW